MSGFEKKNILKKMSSMERVRAEYASLCGLSVQDMKMLTELVSYIAPECAVIFFHVAPILPLM